MRKLILIAHMSLDGYVAGEKGEFDSFTPSPENLDFVCSVTDDADAALMGRVSFQLLESAWPEARNRSGATASEIKYSNWYNDTQRIVISSSLPASNTKSVRVISKNVEEEVAAIKKQEGKSILVFGSPATFNLLLTSNLVDEFWIILYPSLFGKGISLFSDNDFVRKLTLVKTKQLSNGELVINYKVNH